MASSFEQTMRSLERAERLSPWFVSSVLWLACWACWFVCARVDVYASSRSARLEVSDRSNRAAAAEGGRVVALHGALGHSVRAGDVLLELDPSLLRAQLAGELSALDAHAARLSALVRQLSAEKEVGTSRLRLDALATRRASYELSQAEAAAAHQHTLTEIARDLDVRRLSARVDRLNAEADMTDHELRVHRAAIEVERLGAARTFDDKSQSARISELQRQRAELQAEQSAREASIALVRAQLSRLQVRAPVDGVLGSVAALAVGDVVEAGDVVATVVPAQGVHVVAEFDPGQAAGRVLPRQAARVRLSGFSWIEFGILDANVVRVASEPRDGTIRVELSIAQASVPRLPIQHGLPGSVDVRIDRASPLSLVLRSIGAALRPPPDSAWLAGASRGAGS